MQLDPEALNDLRERFLLVEHDFGEFGDPDGAYHRNERSYKDDLLRLFGQLFPEGPVALAFGVEAVRALADEGVPYRALLGVVLTGECPAADPVDPFFASIEGKNPGVLAKKRAELKRAGIDLLTRWRSLQA